MPLALGFRVLQQFDTFGMLQENHPTDTQSSAYGKAVGWGLRPAASTVLPRFLVSFPLFSWNVLSNVCQPLFLQRGHSRLKSTHSLSVPGRRTELVWRDCWESHPAWIPSLRGLLGEE